MSELEDRYELTELIRTERRAKVFKARHKLRGGEYAVKVYPQSVADEPGFDLQVESLRRLHHGSIPCLWDMGRTPQPFLVFDLVVGRSLADECLRCGPLSLHRAIQVMEHVCGALAHAHRLRVVHRALTPDKILLTEEGGLAGTKIVEFDSMLDIDDEASALRRRRWLSGELPYLAPEQIRGDELTAASDVYAAGAIFYHLLTGRPPFRGDMEEVLRAHEEVEVAPPTVVRPELQIPMVGPLIDEIVKRSLAKVPGHLVHERYLNAGPMALGLAGLKAAYADYAHSAAHRRFVNIPVRRAPGESARTTDELPSNVQRGALLALANRLAELPEGFDSAALALLIDVRAREAEHAHGLASIERLRGEMAFEQERHEQVFHALWWELIGLNRRSAQDGNAANAPQLAQQIIDIEQRMLALTIDGREETELRSKLLLGRQKRLQATRAALVAATGALRRRVDEVLPAVGRWHSQLQPLIDSYRREWRDEADGP